jgi:hypothetical protein
MKKWSFTSSEHHRSWRDIEWNKDGYTLEYRVRSPGDTPDTGWYLYGPNGMPFGEYMADILTDAKKKADRYIGTVEAGKKVWLTWVEEQYRKRKENGNV